MADSIWLGAARTVAGYEIRGITDLAQGGAEYVVHVTSINKVGGAGFSTFLSAIQAEAKAAGASRVTFYGYSAVSKAGKGVINSPNTWQGWTSLGKSVDALGNVNWAGFTKLLN